jgi:hypothetical protein
MNRADPVYASGLKIRENIEKREESHVAKTLE